MNTDTYSRTTSRTALFGAILLIAFLSVLIGFDRPVLGMVMAVAGFLAALATRIGW